MKLIKGLQTDNNEQDQVEGSYIWALNWVANTKIGSLVSERGFTLKFALSDDLQPIGMMPTGDKVVVFSTNGLPGDSNKSEIGIYDETTEVYMPVINDDIVTSSLGGTSTGLNFSLQHQIKSVYRFNSKNELEIAFTDWNETPKIMYIGDISVVQFYYNNYSVNKLNIFQSANLGPLDISIGSSGSLTADTYFVFYRYKNIDQTTTGTYIHPEPQYIIIANNYDEYINITGNDIGGTTNKSITVNFTTIDTTFPFMEVGLYQVSTSSAFITETISTGQTSATITSFSGTTVLPADILAEKVFYDKAKTITSLNDQLMLGNLEKSNKTIPQKYINNLALKWTCTFIKPAVEKASKDYNKQVKSFCAGEVYSMLIRFLLKDGTYTQWQHIPGRKAKNIIISPRVISTTPSYSTGTGLPYLSTKVNPLIPINDKDIIPLNDSNFSNYTSPATNNKYFHTTDTCTAGLFSTRNMGSYTTEYLEGDLGYWENESEEYSEYFLGSDAEVWDSSGFLTSLTDNSGTTVRHHRFPTLNFLENNSTDPENFTKKFPQLGVRIKNLDISFLESIVGPIETYELSFSARDFNNCTVYGQDLSLFGVYINEQQDPSPPSIVNSVYNSNIAKNDAIYFTGSNSVIGALSFQSTQTSFDGSGNILGLNSNLVRNFTHNPIDPALGGKGQNQIPNRQRFHTPDLVDPLNPINNPLITPSYVRHEVLMVCGDIIQTNTTSSNKALYTTETTSSNTAIDNSYGLVDYCFDTDNINTNLDTTQYINFCIKNMPAKWVLRNIKGSGYVPKTTRSIQIGSNSVINALFKINDGGGDLYGGSDHFHVQLFDDYFKRTDLGLGYIQEKYPNFTESIMGLYSSFLTQLNYSGAGQTINTDPNNINFYNIHPVPSLNFSRTFSYKVGIRQHHTAFLSSLVKQTKTIYNNFVTITPIEALKDDRDSTIFLGDCFVSEVQYITHGWGNPTIVDPVNNPYAAQNFTAFRFYAHTRKNLDYRYQKTNDPGINNQYYPASRFNVNVIEPAGLVHTTDIFYKGTTSGFNDKTHAYQAFNYNSDYGFQPLFTRVSNIYSNSLISNNNTKFPFRVHESEKQQKESLVNNWRTFLPLNYNENDKTKGEIVNLQGYDDQLLIHTIQSLFITRDRGTLDNSVTGITIGTGGLFDFPPKEVIFDNLGYTGTQHQFGCQMTKLGYVFPDAQQGKYFIYNKDSGIVELSQSGLFNYFKTYGKSIHNDFYNGNASGLSSWNAAYDEYNNRLLIGFNQKISEDPNPYTLSYSDSFKSFTSFHSYIPDLICNTRKSVYSFKGNTFYKHNTSNRGYYSGEPSQTQEIDIVHNTTPITTKSGIVKGGKEYTKLWQSFNWNSEMHTYLDTSIFNLETFTKTSIRTKKQCSELIDLVPFSSTRIYDNTWYFNQFRDRLNRTGPRQEVFNSFISSLNNGFAITYPNSTNFNSRFVDNYVILRLIYATEDLTRELHLIEVDYHNQIVKK